MHRELDSLKTKRLGKKSYGHFADFAVFTALYRQQHGRGEAPATTTIPYSYPSLPAIPPHSPPLHYTSTVTSISWRSGPLESGGQLWFFRRWVLQPPRNASVLKRP